MHDWESQSHVKWDCKYHLVFIPKYRREAIYGTLRVKIGRILRELCDQRGVELQERHALADHVHLCVRIHRKLLGERKMTGLHFWTREYCVSTLGYEEAAVRRYVREQEEQDSGQERLGFDAEW